MIENFSYTTNDITATNTEAGVEAFMAAMPNFTYNGTGSMAGKTYDKIWDYTGFSDITGLSLQVEWYSPAANGSSGYYSCRILKNGVVISDMSSYFNFNAISTDVKIKHHVIKSGNKVIFESASIYYSSIGGISLYRGMNAMTGEADVFGAAMGVQQGSLTQGRLGKVGGLFVSTPGYFAQPVSFGSSDGVTPVHYINDATTAYSIQYRSSGGSVMVMGYSDGFPDGSTVEIDGHQFVKFAPYCSDTSSSNSYGAYALWFRIS